MIEFLQYDFNRATTQALLYNSLRAGKIVCDVRRLDQIHPVISGNKIFKLKYYLEKAIMEKYAGILTFGGAYSNHLVATASAAGLVGLRSVGIVRGEVSKNPSHTLRDCQRYGMQLNHVSRFEYSSLQGPRGIQQLQSVFPGYLVVPEGGYGPDGMKGAAEIILESDRQRYTHICCACGTGTMMAGLALAAGSGHEIIGISVLRGMEDLGQRVAALLPPQQGAGLHFIHDYHFGGYARQSDELFQFMNNFYLQTGIPTDFVYTGKLMYAVSDLVSQDYFPGGSRILVIHSGGLQGNHSLKRGTLVF